MRLDAYAKINICLSVKGKNSYGHHDLEMVMVPISLYDSIDMDIADEFSFTSNVPRLPVDETNTIIKTIDVMRSMFNFKQQFKVRLFKIIPSRAGLAGGSSNAAATIKLLDKLLDLRLTYDQKIDIAKKVGADVPFCLFNKPAYVTGIGEKLQFIDTNMKLNMILVKPYAGISTKEAFANVDMNNIKQYDCYKVIDALLDSDYDKLCNNLGNSLEDISFSMLDSIKQIKEELLSLGFDGVLMTGSGATVYGISKDINLLNRAQVIFRDKKYFARIVKMIV